MARERGARGGINLKRAEGTTDYGNARMFKELVPKAFHPAGAVSDSRKLLVLCTLRFNRLPDFGLLICGKIQRQAAESGGALGRGHFEDG